VAISANQAVNLTGRAWAGSSITGEPRRRAFDSRREGRPGFVGRVRAGEGDHRGHRDREGEEFGREHRREDEPVYRRACLLRGRLLDGRSSRRVGGEYLRGLEQAARERISPSRTIDDARTNGRSRSGGSPSRRCLRDADHRGRVRCLPRIFIRDGVDGFFGDISTRWVGQVDSPPMVPIFDRERSGVSPGALSAARRRSYERIYRSCSRRARARRRWPAAARAGSRGERSGGPS